MNSDTGHTVSAKVTQQPEFEGAVVHQSETPLTDAAIRDARANPFRDDKEFTRAQLHELDGVSIPRGAARIVKHARQMERDRAQLMAALDVLLHIFTDLPASRNYGEAVQHARAALAKATA